MPLTQTETYPQDLKQQYIPLALLRRLELRLTQCRLRDIRHAREYRPATQENDLP